MDFASHLTKRMFLSCFGWSSTASSASLRARSSSFCISSPSPSAAPVKTCTRYITAGHTVTRQKWWISHHPDINRVLIITQRHNNHLLKYCTCKFLLNPNTNKINMETVTFNKQLEDEMLRCVSKVCFNTPLVYVVTAVITTKREHKI